MSDNDVAALAAAQSHAPRPDPDTVGAGDDGRVLGVRGWIVRAGLTSWLLLGVLLLVAAAIWAISQTRTLVSPLIAAFVISAVAVPLVDRLSRRMPRALASGLVVLAIVGAAVGFLALVGWVLYRERQTLASELAQAWADAQDWVATLPIDTSQVVSWLSSAGRGVGSGAGGLLASGAASAASFVVATFLSLILLYYLLKQWDDVLAAAGRAVRPSRRDDTVALLDSAASSVRGYFRGRAAVSAVTSTFMGVGVVVLGIPAAAAIVLVNFVGGFIPYIGAFIGGALAVVLGLASGGVPVALGALGVMLVGNLVVEQLVEPRLVGSSLGLNPMLVLMATTLGGVVAGLPGLILGAPVAATVLTVVRTLRRWNVFADRVAP